VRTITRLHTVVLSAALGIVILSSCGGTTPAAHTSPEPFAGQSVDSACAQAERAVAAVQQDLSGITDDVSAGRFSLVAAQLNTLHETLSDTADQLTNSQVTQKLRTLSGRMGEFADLFADAKDGDMTTFTEQVEELETASRAVASAGEAMNDLCN